jgi:hypothetical protein
MICSTRFVPFVMSFGVTLVAIAATAVAAATTTIHVAPNGNDGNPAGPFATPGRAIQAVRELRKTNGGKLPGPVTIEFGAGTYRLAEPLVLTPEESGTAEAPVVWTAHGHDAVVFSGGVAVTGWKEAELNGRKVWTAKAPAGVHMFRELWVNGEPRVRARHPNGIEYLSVPVAPEPKARWEDGQMQFNYKAGDVPAFTTDDAEVVHFTRWVESRLPVLSNDAKSNELKFRRRTVFQVQAGDLFRIENAPEFLDQPGEWYFRRSSGEVFYLPKSGETLNKFEAVVPRLAQLVRLEGKPEAGQFIENVSFRGITFAHDEWSLPEEGTDPKVDGKPNRGGFVQAAYGVPGAVWAEGARNCAFEHCTFAHLGSYGIELGRGCQDNRISHCTLDDLGAGGVKLGELQARDKEAERTFRNQITDCTIGNYGRLYMSAIGVYVGKTYENVIAHNEIHDGFYTGISIGWTWGYDPTITKNNVIEHNDIHHIGKLSTGEGPLISDMGGIYTLGTQPGTVIRFNRFHDVAGRMYGGWGIYFDEGSSQILAEKNLVYNTTHGGFHQHYGKENVVRNNIFAYGRDMQVQRTRAEDHQSFTFERNIVIWNSGPGVVGDWKTNLNAVFRNNQYWPYDNGKAIFGLQPFEKWRARGMDDGSVIADPGFVDPEHGDFRFKPGKGPTESIGFQQWDLSDVGPRPSSN